MSLTIQNLVDSKQFCTLHSINHLGMQRQIQGVHIIEALDMDRFINEGELLLTSLKVYYDLTQKKFESCLDQLLDKRICGFIVKRTSNLNEHQNLYNSLKIFCEKCDLALIEIPESQQYWSLIKYIMLHVYDSKMARLAYFKLTHDNFTSLLLTTNTIESTTERILKLLETMIGNPLALFYSNHACFYSTNEDMSKLVFEKNIEDYRPDIITKFKYLRQKKQELTQYIVKIDILGKIEVLLLISETNTELTSLDYMALENAIVTLQYSFMGTYAENQIEKKYQRDISYNMLNGLLSNKEMDAFAHMVSLNEESMYSVVSFHTIHKNKKQIYTKEQLTEVGIIEGELNRLLGDEHMYRSLDSIVYIHEVQAGDDEGHLREVLENVYNAVNKQIQHRKSKTDFQIGIGKPVKGYQHLKDSYDDAKKAIDSIDLVRILLDDPQLSIVDSSKLGFFKIFEDIKDPEELFEYVPESLKLLIQHDKNHKDDLIKTLQCYLDNNQSSKKTADDLFVNYRTITYRLDKIKNIAGINFHNIGEMLAIRNGLLILKMIYNL